MVIYIYIYIYIYIHVRLQIVGADPDLLLLSYSEHLSDILPRITIIAALIRPY